MAKLTITISFAFLFFSSAPSLNAQNVLRMETMYSRGNDDLAEINHETAKISLTLVISQQKANFYAVNLQYSARFSVDHPHNPQSENYWLKQVLNQVEPNLSISQFTYEPGPDGTSLNGRVVGEIFLGELRNPADGPYRGRIAITLQPYFDIDDLRPIDSWIEWGFMVQNGKPMVGNLSMTAQWKGGTRPSEEMLRLISSNFIDPSHFRPPFPKKN